MMFTDVKCGTKANHALFTTPSARALQTARLACDCEDCGQTPAEERLSCCGRPICFDCALNAVPQHPNKCGGDRSLDLRLAAGYRRVWWLRREQCRGGLVRGFCGWCKEVLCDGAPDCQCDGDCLDVQ